MILFVVHVCIQPHRPSKEVPGSLFLQYSSRVSLLPFFKPSLFITLASYSPIHHFVCEWIISGFVDFRYYHVAAYLPDNATTSVAVASLPVSAVNPDLPLIMPPLHWRHIHAMHWRVLVIPTNEYSSGALFILAKISPQTKWSSHFVCHQFQVIARKDESRYLLPSSMCKRRAWL